MKRITLLVMALVAIFLVTGCIDYTEELTLNADGSGSVRMHIVMDKQFMRDMEEMTGEYGNQEQEQEEEICSEAEMRAALKEMNSGIELVEYTQNETDEKIEYRFEFKFSDYEDFKDLQYACGEDNGETSETGFDFTYEKQGDGSWLFQRFTESGEGDMEYGMDDMEGMEYGDDASDTDEEDAGTDRMDLAEVDLDKLGEAMSGLGEAMQGMAGGSTEGSDYDESAGAVDMEAMMQGMMTSMQRAQADMKNHKMIYIVHLPGKIGESNATELSGNTATWEYRLDQLEGKPAVLEAVVKP